jgi:hypothetical protein
MVEHGQGRAVEASLGQIALHVCVVAALGSQVRACNLNAAALLFSLFNALALSSGKESENDSFSRLQRRLLGSSAKQVAMAW